MTDVVILAGSPAAPPPPPVPTRAQVCGVRLTFSGLMVTTQQYGTQPWFEPAYQCLTDAADRASVRQQKRAAGDTHLILECYTHPQSIYDEPGQWTQGCITPSGEQSPQWFRGLVEEVIADRLTPIVVFDGDNGDNPADGYPNALRQLPILAALLGDLADRILFARFWDGVFYGSTPENIQAFGTAFRQVLPNGYLAIEHQPGRIPVGGGTSDYAPGGRMDAYDVVCGEFDTTPTINPPTIVGGTWDPAHGNYAPVYSGDASPYTSIWQVLGRTIRPFTRPANMPMHVPVKVTGGPQDGQVVPVSADSDTPPMYLVDSPRGPRFYIVLEDGEYEWVRRWITVDQLRTKGQYYRAQGAPYVCLP